MRCCCGEIHRYATTFFFLKVFINEIKGCGYLLHCLACLCYYCTCGRTVNMSKFPLTTLLEKCCSLHRAMQVPWAYFVHPADDNFQQRYNYTREYTLIIRQQQYTTLSVCTCEPALFPNHRALTPGTALIATILAQWRGKLPCREILPSCFGALLALPSMASVPGDSAGTRAPCRVLSRTAAFKETTGSTFSVE